MIAYPGRMGGHTQIARWIDRRGAVRLRLGMPARLITPDCTLRVVLDDLSEGGAKITLTAPHDFLVCVLRWMDHHAFANVIWRDGHSLGMEFDKPLCTATLEETCRYAHGLVAQQHGEQGLRYC